MPTFYNFRENGLDYSFDDIFVPAEWFREGSLWIWGSGGTALGTNDTTNRTTPVTTFSGGTNWKQVSCGRFHTGAIKTDGTLWVWGGGANGRLGTNSTANRSTPVTTFAGGTNWKQVNCTDEFSVAIKSDGTLWIWGLNSSAQLGTNDVIARFTPITTFAGGTNWKQVSSSRVMCSAIKTDGTLWTWGNNDNGQLGTNDTIVKSTPVTTFSGGTNWKQVTCGSAHVAAIKTDGTLWTWGYGRLGTNDTIAKSTPVTTFAGGTNWKQVSCRAAHTAAIKTDGTLWMWGSNTVGQLAINIAGAGAAGQRITPVTTFSGGTNWKQVSCGNAFTTAIKTDGTLWTWGQGTSGQLGNNETTNKSTPVTTFAGGTNWKTSSAGFNFSNHASAITYEDPGL